MIRKMIARSDEVEKALYLCKWGVSFGEIASTAVAAASELLRAVHHFAAKNCFEDDHVFESILWHREDVIGEYGHVGILARLN